MAIRFGVIVFPGSNCDHDAYHATKHVFDQETRFIWHEEETLGDVDVVVIPGGFSYGDYLRSGAIARFSPIMEDIVQFAENGGLVFGICNGFQILCEVGLLPGTLLRNQSLRFICKNTTLRVENENTPFTSALEEGQVVTFPVSHGEGRFYADEEVLQEIERKNLVIARYCTPDGEVTEDANPNGSLHNIAGIVNEERNVCGLMPHPERCVESLLGNNDGRRIFESILEHEFAVPAV